MNPFTHFPDDGTDATDDALAMLQSLLELMAAPRKGINDAEASLLKEALLETWERLKQQATISDIAEWLQKQVNPQAKSLGNQLIDYTRGSYRKFFHGLATVELNQPLVVIELEDIRSHSQLKDVIVQMAMINITNRLARGNRKTNFHIILDEAWDLLNNPKGKEFMERLCRTVRKYKGSLVVGTQSINDFYANPSAQTVFDNSDWHCFLSQKPEAIAQLKQSKKLAVTEHLEQQLNSLRTQSGRYAEIAIKGPTGFAITRLLLDPYAQLLYSSRADDYAAVKQLQDEGLSVAEALDRLLAERGIHQ